MRAFLLALITLLMLPMAALAQSADRPNTILVLDGSGSMWGQIDGVNKIVIARNVIAEMLEEMADDVSLGLTVYGHRQRGSCADIETIVEPAPFTQDRILEAVNSINPRGRTPMTDAVVAAAQSLRHTEEAATVILVSDGIENCNPDPCAIAAELEATGVAFTAHVIGFDVASEPEARAQMQCIADNTGGQFLTADNAAELSAALEQIVAVVMPVPTRIEAIVVPQMVAPTRPVTWRVLDATGAAIVSGLSGATIATDLLPGDYVAEATRTEPGGDVAYRTSFIVADGQTAPVQVAMPSIVETSQVTFTARVEPDMSVPASQLAWTLYDMANAVLLGPVVAPGGNVALLPGDYRLEVERANTGTRHEARFSVEANTPQELIIPLPALSVNINFVARIGDVGGVTITDPMVWEVTPLSPAPEIATSNPATLPMTRGAYRVTAYWTVQEVEQSVDFVVVDQPREIIVVFPVPVPTASVSGPAEAPMGSIIEVTWDGPGNPNDIISIGQVGEGFTRYVSPVTIGTAQNPARVLMPSEAGPFEIRYSDAESRTVIARTLITSTQVTATVTGPAEVPVGSEFEVSWTGPDYPNDLIVMAAPDASTNSYTPTLATTGTGPILTLTAPTEPGVYELRYRMNQNGVILTRTAITVVEETATITAPASAVAGATIELSWTGPDNDGDFIGVTAVDRDEYNRFENMTRTNEGSPLDLLMPTVPGAYVLEYVLAEDRARVIAVPITVTPAEATITAPASAVAGSTIELGWTGPGYNDDFIGVTAVGDDGYNRFAHMTRTNEGSPLDLLMPAEPGDYIIEYVIGQDRPMLASVPITVTEASATLTAPASAIAGSSVEIGWTGPGYGNDFIAITRVGDEGYHRFDQSTRTNEGSPLDLLMPTEPGEYVLEYVLGQDRTALTTTPITIVDVAATITAPASAIAGSTIELGWTGPGYSSDFIAITAIGAEGYHRFANSTRTNEGSPLDLLMPTEPGAYILEYVLGQDRSALTTVPITVTEAAATITAPATAIAGASVEIAWTGPDYQRDFIAITPVGEDGYHRFDSQVRTSDGSPMTMVMPSTPGNYIIEYVIGQDRSTLTSVPISVEISDASITAPTTAVGGSTIDVTWTGPNSPRDYIGIGRVGANGASAWESFVYTRDGTTIRLLVPVAPGAYEISYFLGADRETLVTVPLTVAEVMATITAPASAPAGSTLEVGFTGPNYDNDYIGIGRVGANGSSAWESFIYTRDGSPAQLQVPGTPGAYEISYFAGQNRSTLSTVAIEVTAVEATLTAPAVVVAGASVEFGWTGPGYDGDYIAIGRVGATGSSQWQAFAYTRDGNPARMTVPTEPGEYLLRYFLGEGRIVIGEVPVTVQ